MSKKHLKEKIRKKYSLEDLKAAVEAVKGGRSISSVSREKKIPRATIFSKISGKSPLNKNVGPATILSEEEESQIVRWILHVSSYGHPVTKLQLINSVTRLIKNMQRKTPFVNGRPGRSWYEAFLRRHPEITKRVAQNLTYSRSSLTEHAIRGWFSENGAYLKKKNLENIGADRIFNGDESAFLLNPKNDYVLVKKGEKSVYQHIGNNEKESLTVLFVANATEKLAPPMVVFNYERLPATISESVPDSWAIGKSPNGWMTSETFYEYVANVFEPWLSKNKIERPVVLFIDGHSSHLTMELSDFCSQSQIELIALYPNATHIMQPLDVSFFKPLKAKYKECVSEWRLQNDGNSLKKENCAPILKIAVDNIDASKIITSGFKKCGLYPFDADAIDYSKVNKPGSVSIDKSINKTSTDANEYCEEKNFLKILEKYIIAKNVLAEFYKCESTGIWDGDVQHVSLFDVWLSARRRFCAKNSVEFCSEELISDIQSNCAWTINNIEINDEVIHQNLDDIPVVIVNAVDDLDLQNLDLNENIVSISEPTDEIIAPPTEIVEFHETSKQSDNTEDNRIIPEGVPSPFKKVLFWPKAKIINKTRKSKVKIPSAATSEEWKSYHNQKEEEKEKRAQEIAEKKRKRQEVAEEKQIA